MRSLSVTVFSYMYLKIDNEPSLVKWILVMWHALVEDNLNIIWKKKMAHMYKGYPQKYEDRVTRFCNHKNQTQKFAAFCIILPSLSIMYMNMHFMYIVTLYTTLLYNII